MVFVVVDQSRVSWKSCVYHRLGEEDVVDRSVSFCWCLRLDPLCSPSCEKFLPLLPFLLVIFWVQLEVSPGNDGESPHSPQPSLCLLQCFHLLFFLAVGVDVYHRHFVPLHCDRDGYDPPFLDHNRLPHVDVSSDSRRYPLVVCSICCLLSAGMEPYVLWEGRIERDVFVRVMMCFLDEDDVCS